MADYVFSELSYDGEEERIVSAGYRAVASHQSTAA